MDTPIEVQWMEGSYNSAWRLSVSDTNEPYLDYYHHEHMVLLRFNLDNMRRLHKETIKLLKEAYHETDAFMHF